MYLPIYLFIYLLAFRLYGTGTLRTIFVCRKNGKVHFVIYFMSFFSKFFNASLCASSLVENGSMFVITIFSGKHISLSFMYSN